MVEQRFLEIFLVPQVVWRPSSGLAQDGALHRHVAACQRDEQEAGQPLLSKQQEGPSRPHPAWLRVGCRAWKVPAVLSLTSLHAHGEAGCSPWKESALFSLHKDITRWPGLLSSQVCGWWAGSKAVSGSRASLLPAAAMLSSPPSPALLSRHAREH